MTPDDIRAFLAKNEVAFKIIRYVCNEPILQKLIEGVNITSVSTRDIIKNVPELRDLENPKKHIRVLGAMGLLQHVKYSGRISKRGKSNVVQYWIAAPEVRNILIELKNKPKEFA
jgi:hypothetical protein